MSINGVNSNFNVNNKPIQTGNTETTQVANNKTSESVFTAANNENTIAQEQQVNNTAQNESITTKQEEKNVKTVENETGTTTTKFADDGTTPKEVVENNTVENYTQTTTFDEQGQKSQSVKVKEGLTETIKYANNEPSTKTIKQGNNVENYNYVNGQERLESKIENQGHDVLEKKTTYEYNENGNRISATFTDAKGSTKTIQYDGNGNTKTNVNAGESLNIIAQKANCSVDDLKKLNPKVTNSNIQAGQEIIVPNERGADDKFIQGRQTVEEAKAKGNAAELKRQEQENTKNTELKEKVLAEYNAKKTKEQEEQTLQDMGLRNRNGEGEKIKVQDRNGISEMTKIGEAGKGRTIAQDTDGKFHTISPKGVVLSEEYAQRTDAGTAKGKQILEQNKQEFANYKTQLEAAKSDFNKQMNKDGIAADVADGVSKLWNNHTYGDKLGINTGNTASQVREDFDKMQNTLDEMEIALENNDIERFNRLNNRIKSNPQLDKITNRVQTYNQSQDDGAQVVKGVAVTAATAAAAISTGGASIAVQAATAGVAAGASTYVTESIDTLTEGEGQGKAFSQENWQNLSGKQGEILYDSSKNTIIAAGSTVAAVKVGSKIADVTRKGKFLKKASETATYSATNTTIDAGFSVAEVVKNTSFDATNQMLNNTTMNSLTGKAVNVLKSTAKHVRFRP